MSITILSLEFRRKFYKEVTSTYRYKYTSSLSLKLIFCTPLNDILF